MSKINGKIIVSDPKVFEKFSNVIYRPIENEDIYTPLELFVKNIKAKLSKEKKGGKKSKRNIKMTRKFRRTRRKRGRGSGAASSTPDSPEMKCRNNQWIINSREEYQTEFNNRIKEAIVKFEDLKNELDKAEESVNNFKPNQSGGAAWSKKANEEYQRRLARIEQAKKDIKDFKTSLGDIKYFYSWDEHINKLLKGNENYFKEEYEKEIEQARKYFNDNDCENLLKEGGRKSRRKKRRKSKKRKSRRRKKRSRRRKRKKR